MKGGAFYASSVAVTRNSLVATSCTCKAGSHGLERGVCVHNLPLILQLVLLLVDGLANHMLVELCQRWTSHLESKLDGLGKSEMTKKAILTLMKANGSEHTSSLFHLSINEILKNRFDVGTEKPKTFNDPGEAREEDLVPLRLYDISSDTKKAKEKLKSLQIAKDDNNESNNALDSTTASNPSTDDAPAEDSTSNKDDSSSLSCIQPHPSTTISDTSAVDEAPADDKAPADDSTFNKDSCKAKLPPGWKVEFSRTKNRPYYVHPDHGVTWFFPCHSGWKQMFCEKKNRMYYVHQIYGKTWHRPAAYSPTEQEDNKDVIGGKDDNNDYIIADSLLRLRGGGRESSEEECEEIKILKKVDGGALEAVECDFCSSMQTSHVCRAKIPNGSCMIEGEEEKICGKAICLLCSEGKQISELERRTRCPVHASKNESKQKTEATKKGAHKSSSAMCTDPSFIPDYIEVVSSIEPLQNIMKCGEKDFELEKRKNIPGLRLLKMRKMRQEEREFLSKPASRTRKRKKRKSAHGMWKEAFSKALLRQDRKKDEKNKRICSANQNPILFSETSLPPPPSSAPSQPSPTQVSKNSSAKFAAISSNLLSPPKTKTKNNLLLCQPCSPILDDNKNPNIPSQQLSSLSQKKKTNIKTKTKKNRLPLVYKTNKNQSEEKEKKKRKCHQSCKFVGCTNHDGMKNIKLTHVPKPAAEKSIPKPTDRVRAFINYHSKDLQHKEFLEVMELPAEKYNYHNTRICNEHTIIEVEKTMNIEREVKGKMTTQKIKFKYQVPADHGVNSTLQKSRQSLKRRTTARERRRLNEWSDCYEDLKNKAGEKHAKDYIQLATSYQQIFEDHTPTKTKASASNNADYNPFLSPLGIKLGKSEKTRGFKRRQCEIENPFEKKAERNLHPTVRPNTLSKRQVKRRTGFKCETAMLKYIMIVCNGDFDTLTTTATNLTWYEEWFLFFEMMWGKSHTRVEDLVDLFRLEKNDTFYHIIKHKLDLVLACRTSWPTYATFEEDKLLQKEKWEEKYGESRIVMWDDTNIPFTYQPSTSRNQKITYSSYYAMNCSKGGVFLQLCGWIGVEELWVGATSDSVYMEKSGILKRQKKFAENDKVDGKYIPFTIILDKGYRIIRIAWREGKQTCLQPKFAKSDNQFSSDDLLFSGSVAADRSGNERAVHYCKVSSTLKRGLKPNGNPARLNKIWEAWSFQTNFMYGSVL